jgi:hypothetical protein
MLARWLVTSSSAEKAGLLPFSAAVCLQPPDAKATERNGGGISFYDFSLHHAITACSPPYICPLLPVALPAEAAAHLRLLLELRSALCLLFLVLSLDMQLCLFSISSL